MIANRVPTLPSCTPAVQGRPINDPDVCAASVAAGLVSEGTQMATAPRTNVTGEASFFALVSAESLARASVNAPPIAPFAPPFAQFNAWSNSASIAEQAAKSALQPTCTTQHSGTDEASFALASAESLARASDNSPPIAPFAPPSAQFNVWCNPASIAEQAAESALQPTTQHSGTDDASFALASAESFARASGNAPPIAPFAPPSALFNMWCNPASIAEQAAKSASQPAFCTASAPPTPTPLPPTPAPSAPPFPYKLLAPLSTAVGQSGRLRHPSFTADIAIRSGIGTVCDAMDASTARAIDDGRSQSAVLGVKLSREREKVATVVSEAASSIVDLRRQLAELRRAGMDSAVREMSARHACDELRESNVAWAKEASVARASAVVDAFEMADPDAIAHEVFKCETQGIFACRSGIDGFLHDISQARAGKTGNRKSPVTKAFFAKLAVKAGPALAQWAAEVLGEGTAVVSKSHIRETLKRHPNVAIGHDEAAVTTNITRAKEFYTEHGIHTEETDYVVDEDATAHAKHVEVKIHNGRVRAFGLGGGPYDIESKTELLELLQKHGLSSTTYVHLLVPQTRKTPTFPIAMSESNNKFDRLQVHRQQMLILRVFKRVTGLNSIHTFDSDGDARCRRQYLMMQFNTLHDHLFMTMDHQMIRIRVPHIDGYGFVMFDQCDMHVAWRFAIQYLKLKTGSSPSYMRLGPLRYCPGDFQRAATSAKLPQGQRITVAAFGVHDKQNEIGCRLKGGLSKAGEHLPDSENFLITLRNDKEEAHLRPDILYHMVLGRYISLHVDKSLSIIQRAESAGFVLEFVAELRASGRDGRYFAQSPLAGALDRHRCAGGAHAKNIALEVLSREGTKSPAHLRADRLENVGVLLSADSIVRS